MVRGGVPRGGGYPGDPGDLRPLTAKLWQLKPYDLKQIWTVVRKTVQSSLDWLEKALSTLLFSRQSEIANRFVLYLHKMRYLVEISEIQSETELSEWRPF